MLDGSTLLDLIAARDQSGLAAAGIDLPLAALDDLRTAICQLESKLRGQIAAAELALQNQTIRAAHDMLDPDLDQDDADWFGERARQARLERTDAALAKLREIGGL